MLSAPDSDLSWTTDVGLNRVICAKREITSPFIAVAEREICIEWTRNRSILMVANQQLRLLTLNDWIICGRFV